MARARLAIGSYGNISTRAKTSGGWEASCRYRDLDGITRQVRASGSTSASAEAALREDLVSRKRTTGGTLNGESRVSALLDHWVASLQVGVEAGQIQPGTYEVYERTARLHIKPAIGGLALREVTTGTINKLLSSHQAAGRSARHLKTSLVQAFAHALDHEALTTNPAAGAKRLTHASRKQVRALTVGDVAIIRQLVQAWQTRKRSGPTPSRDLADIVLLLIATGCRIGEVLALRWWDIDLLADQPVLRVTGTIVQVKGKGNYRRSSPKTQSSVRTLRLPPQAVAMLLDRQMNCDSNAENAVFLTRTGTWYTVAGLQRRWRQITDDTPYAWVTFHTFRKTVATLVSEHLDDRTAALQLGHGSEAVTREHYIERRQEAPDLSGILGPLLG